MRKIWQRIAIVVFIVSIIIVNVEIMTFLTRPTDADQCIENIKAFHNLPDDSVEVMIYGSSHGWRGVNTIEMYEKYGIGAYNYCGNWQTLSTEELFLFDSLDTQRPKAVLIEGYLIGNTLFDVDFNGEIFYTRAIPNSEMKKEYIRRAFNGDYQRLFFYYFPFAQFHSNWNRIGKNAFVNYYTQSEFIGTMGYYYMPYDDNKISSVQIDNPEMFTQIQLDNNAITVLDEIVEKCHKNEIDVIFFTLPWEGEYLFADALNEYAQKNDCVYLDFFSLKEEAGIDGNTDFFDVDHLNNSGATKVANYLGKYLRENYELTDMRHVKNNLWEGKSGNRTGNKWLEYNSLTK